MGKSAQEGMEGLMEKRKETHEELSKQLVFCESRLKELKAKPAAGELGKDVGELESELKTCRIELNEMEGKSGDEWEDAKNSITRRLRDMQTNLGLSARGSRGFIR